MKKSVLGLVLFSLLSFSTVYGQSEVSSEIQAQVRTEISKRGLDEATVRQRLLAEGIDVDQLTMDELPAVQPKITKIIAEMEAEQKAKAITQNAAKEMTTGTIQQTEEIQELVEDGATVEEAIAEEIIEQRNESLPPSRIYGQSIFRDKSLELYRASKDLTPPDTYVMSVGDRVSINIFGASQADLILEIEADGFIRPAGLPKIYLKGLRFGEAKKLLARRFAQGYLFRAGEFAVSLNTARTISINIFGEVEQPGSYSISAINTAFNALIAAGGPTDLGSVREIQLIRNGKTQKLDVYAFMNNPAIQFDYYLEENDILFIPTVDRMVQVEGAVKRPMFYELKKGEVLNDLLDYAGGLSTNAYTDWIQIQRTQNNEQVLIDVALQAALDAGTEVSLDDGDVIRIREIAKAAENVVSISGAVEYEGDYALVEGMRLSDLMAKGVLSDGARLDLAFFSRVDIDNGQKELTPIMLNEVLENPAGEQNIMLQKGDQLLIFTQAAFLDNYEVSISGAVRAPGTFAFDNPLTVVDVVSRAGGTIESALDFAYLIRTDRANPIEKTYVRINLKGAMEDPNGADNLALEPLDEIRILDRNTFTEGAIVSIQGGVRSPGDFPYAQNLTAVDLLRLAGGLTEAASARRIEIFRVQFQEETPTQTLMYAFDLSGTDYMDINPEEDFELLPYDQVFVRNLPDYHLQEMVKLEGEVIYPGDYALLNRSETLADLIQRAGGITDRAFLNGATLYRSDENKGLVTISLEQALNKPSSFDNIVLKAGDILNIPSKDQTVTIYLNGTKIQKYGTLASAEDGKIIVPFSGTKSAKWYINEYANGFYGKSRRGSVTVEYPNGYVAGSNGFLGMYSYPDVEMGSEIRMQKREKKEKKEKEEKENRADINEIFATTVGAITTSLTLILLIQQLTP